jgi:arsenical pump membrane protein
MLYVVAAMAILGIAVRPRGIPAWAPALAGAIAVVALGYESIGAAAGAIAKQWNVLLFILGLMGLSTAAEETGAFEWVTRVLTARARGSRRRLFVLLFLGGAVLTVALSNDATAIVFTPIVYRTVAKRVDDVLPFLYGCIFVADTASFGLPFSNPANVLVVPRPHVLEYLWHLGPPEVLAIAINLVLFLVLFRHRLRGRYAVEEVPEPQPAALRSLAAMGCVALAYVAALCLDWPLGPVAAIGAAAVIIVARIKPVDVARRLDWGTLALLGGLFAIFEAIARGGFVDWASRELAGASHHGQLPAIAAAAVGATLLSNVLNNLPVAVASSYVVAHGGTQTIAYPLIVGIDLGPNLTLVGSMATILWLAVLRNRGVRVSAREYFRLGAVVVPPMVLVNVLWLWLVR